MSLSFVCVIEAQISKSLAKLTIKYGYPHACRVTPKRPS